MVFQDPQLFYGSWGLLLWAGRPRIDQLLRDAAVPARDAAREARRQLTVREDGERAVHHGQLHASARPAVEGLAHAGRADRRSGTPSPTGGLRAESSTWSLHLVMRKCPMNIHDSRIKFRYALIKVAQMFSICA